MSSRISFLDLLSSDDDIPGERAGAIIDVTTGPRAGANFHIELLSDMCGRAALLLPVKNVFVYNGAV